MLREKSKFIENATAGLITLRLLGLNDYFFLNETSTEPLKKKIVFAFLKKQGEGK